jgi:hypothetical protein
LRYPFHCFFAIATSQSSAYCSGSLRRCLRHWPKVSYKLSTYARLHSCSPFPIRATIIFPILPVSSVFPSLLPTCLQATAHAPPPPAVELPPHHTVLTTP